MFELVNPLTKEQQAQAQFILMLLQNEFGGTPALGVGPDGAFVVVPTCECNRCRDFRKTYSVKPSETILGAAKHYGDDRICFMETKEAVDEGRAVH